ncbi:hypothetical protein GCM10023091_16430 [Ravibacter arvi]|uniref:Toxin SymE-like domain-containing protein n=1 Tax=Ravibacter arvi TaxID=2051041 RepID=A0ABP8LUW1_9BACT
METIKEGQAKVRTLKVYDKIFTRGGNVAYGRHQVVYPEIRLMGQWLADCGFGPGQHIEVVQEEGRLTIRKVER